MKAALLFLARAPLARVYGGPAWLRWGLRAAFYGSFALWLPAILSRGELWWLFLPGLLWSGLVVWQVGAESR